MKRKITSEWRQFEQLVSRIEATAAGKNAVVKSPDMIPDIVTGKLREVDASIRCKIGTTEVLITVECRKRRRKEDDTWIEQLATKRSKIGAAKTIAVSSKGFSDSAKKTAQLHNIELRHLKEISAADLDSWFLPGGAVHLFREVHELLCVWYLRKPNGEAEDMPRGITDPTWQIFYNADIQSPFPAAALLEYIEKMKPRSFWTVPLDGSKTRLQFTLTVPPKSLFVQPESDKPKRDIHHVFIECLISYQSAVCPLETGKHHIYSSPAGDNIQHSSFQSALFGMPVRFEHQSDSSKHGSVSCQFLPEQLGNEKKKKE